MWLLVCWAAQFTFRAYDWVLNLCQWRLFLFIFFAYKFQYRIPSINFNYINWKSVDVAFEIRNQDHMMVGTDESTELWRPPPSITSNGSKAIGIRTKVIAPRHLDSFWHFANKFVLQLRDWKGKREKLLFYESRYCKNVNVESIDSRGLAADGLPGWLACLAGW